MDIQNDEENIQSLFRAAKDINGLSINDVAHITGRSAKSTESILYDFGRKPAWRDCQLMLIALAKAGMKIPRGLRRYVNADIMRVRRWGEKNRTETTAEYVGDFVIERQIYIYRGNKMSLTDISAVTKIKYETLYRRIKIAHIEPGGSVEAVTDSYTDKRIKQ